MFVKIFLGILTKSSNTVPQLPWTTNLALFQNLTNSKFSLSVFMWSCVYLLLHRWAEGVQRKVKISLRRGQSSGKTVARRTAEQINKNTCGDRPENHSRWILMNIFYVIVIFDGYENGALIWCLIMLYLLTTELSRRVWISIALCDSKFKQLSLSIYDTYMIVHSPSLSPLSLSLSLSLSPTRNPRGSEHR